MILDGPIMALDIATRMGVAVGRPGEAPRSWAVTLKKPNDEGDVALCNLIAFIEKEWRGNKPGLIVKEQALSIQAMMRLRNFSYVAPRTYKLHGILEGMAKRYGIRCIDVAVATVRKHFLGTARNGDRKDAKAAVIKRCVQLGYLSILEPDNDRADALAIFDWAAATIAHTPPKDLHMFTQGAAA